MLKADIRLSDLSLPAQWKQGSIAIGCSRIEPHAHPLLETLLVRTEGQWFVVVRERLASAAAEAEVKVEVACRDVDAEAFGRLYRQCLLWPLDYVMIEAAQAGCRMKVRAGAFGSVPVYCRAWRDRLCMSWDSADLLAEPAALDAEIASHRLALRTVYSARQLCCGIVLLTERASLYVEPGKASYRYPPSADETVPAPLPDGREALAEFDQCLQRIVTARPAAAGRIVVELSGGMDSAAVAAAAVTAYGWIASRGILLDGDVRRPQLRRRRRIASRLGLLDETVEMSAFPPDLDLQPAPARRDGLHWEYYREACAAMWASARAAGRDTLFTGIGGDELFPIYADEAQASRDDDGGDDAAYRFAEALLTPRAASAARSLRSFDAPPSAVPSTVLLAHASRAADVLNQGFWPVNPLGDPRLVALCHCLPRQDRRGRGVVRRYLRARLGEDVFPRGYRKETFTDVLPELIARHAQALAAQLRDCALSDLGLVERNAALALLEHVAATRAPAPTTALAAFLWLERLARRVS